MLLAQLRKVPFAAEEGDLRVGARPLMRREAAAADDPRTAVFVTSLRLRSISVPD